MTEYTSKSAYVQRPPYELYMAFVDLRRVLDYLPEDKKQGVEADYDHLRASVQGFPIGVQVHERVPYSRISLVDDGTAPFAFKVDLCFDAGTRPDQTLFHIGVEADLNFMLKMMVGSKIQEALDKVVDGLAAVSEGRMPEGVDPSMFPQGFGPRG